MEQNTPTPSDLSPKTPLPVAAIIQEAFTLPWKYKKTLFLVGLPFLIVWVVGNAFTIMMLTNTQDPDAISGTWLLLGLIAFIVTIIASVYAVVRFHRIFVLEDTQTAMQSESWWSYREWRFLG